LAIKVMNAHDTPSGTKMMWKARVNAICARAHGTGFTWKTAASALSVAVMTSPSLADVPIPGITRTG
jgi:hypothetical protein